MSVLEQVGIGIGIVTGVSAFVLSIINHRHLRDTTQPRLRVRPRVMHIVDCEPQIGRDTTEHNVAVMEVMNVGSVSVVGSMIGFSSPNWWSKKGMVINRPSTLGGQPWPGELAPGHSVLLRMEVKSLIEPMKEGQVGRAFVNTMVGDAFQASRRHMRAFRKSVMDVARELEGENAT